MISKLIRSTKGQNEAKILHNFERKFLNKNSRHMKIWFLIECSIEVLNR